MKHVQKQSSTQRTSAIPSLITPSMRGWKGWGILLFLLFTMSVQAQKTATVTGYSPALKDGTVAESFVNNVRVTSDTVQSGRFTLTVPVERLTKSSLILEGEGCPNHLLTIYLTPGAKVSLTGDDCLFPLWKIDSPVPEQQTVNRIIECHRESLAEMLRLSQAQAKWEEEEPVYVKWLKQTMDALPSVPVDAASLNILEGVIRTVKGGLMSDFPYMEQLKELEVSTAARAPKGFEEDLAVIHAFLYPPHVVQVGEEPVDAELIDMQGQKHRLSELMGKNCEGRYVLLDFWSLGCGPCRMAEPEMRLAYEQSQGKLVIIGINRDNIDGWQKDDFSKKIVWPNWNDGKMGRGGIETRYCDMAAVPYYVLISPDNCILWKAAGYGMGWFLGMAEAAKGPRQDNTQNLQFAVRTIDLKPDATKVTFRYYGKEGYWFRIVSGSYLTVNGKKYRLTHADGVKLDEDNFPQMKVAEAGEGVLGAMRYSDFTLTFEPFETPPAAFDFIEGDVEGAFAIRNISTKQ